MNDFDKITKAMRFASKKHKGQLDDEGKDYFAVHLGGVASIVKMLTNDVNIICAAYLHDTIEDTNTTYEELRKEFGKRVADLVNELTHEGQKDEYGYYFPRLKSKEAIMIKLVDRANNLSRMRSWSKTRQQQYLNKTKFWKDGTDKDE